MDSAGHLTCLLIATLQNDVVIERFFERYSEHEKAAIRRAFHSTQKELTSDSPEAVGRFRWPGDAAECFSVLLAAMSPHH